MEKEHLAHISFYLILKILTQEYVDFGEGKGERNID